MLSDISPQIHTSLRNLSPVQGSISVVYPFFLHTPEVKEWTPKRSSHFEDAIRDWVVLPGAPSAPEGWTVQTSNEINNNGRMRWLIQEVRRLFQTEADDLQGSKDVDSERVEPRIRLLERTAALTDTTDAGGDGFSLALIKRFAPKRASETAATETTVVSEMRLLEGFRATMSASVTSAGTFCFIVSYELGKSATLGDAMELAYYAAHAIDSDGTSKLVLVPKQVTEASKARWKAPANQLRSELQQKAIAAGKDPAEGTCAREIQAEIENALGSYKLTEEEVKACYSFGVHDLQVGAGKDRRRIAIPSFFEQVVIPKFKKVWLPKRLSELKSSSWAFRYGSHGRVPMLARYLMPQRSELEKKLPGLSAEVRRELLEAVEICAARGMRYPAGESGKWTELPIPLESHQCEEFRTVPFSGSQRLHVSIQGMVCWGYYETEFDLSNMGDKFDQQYSLVYMLCLLQSLACQRLSFISYAKKDGRRDNSALMERYLEYLTDFDFSIISYQARCQTIYRVSRQALGVERFLTDVREELTTWVEDEQRREQQALNALALVLLVGGIATGFISLNFQDFNDGSQVAMFFGDEPLHSGFWWFWLPAGLVLLGIVLWPRLRTNIARILGGSRSRQIRLLNRKRRKEG